MSDTIKVTADKDAVTKEAVSVQNAADKVPEGKRFVSWGWRVHNEITYRAINWLLNSTIGVATAYFIQRTSRGAKISNVADKSFEWMLSTIFKVKNPTTLAEGAQWGTRLLSIMAGGFTIIPLMMLMESKKVKKKVVRWLDEKIYGEEIIRNDPKFEASYCKIDEEPKKGFWVGLCARFIALFPLFVICFTPSLNKWPTKYLYDLIGRYTKLAAEKIGIKPAGMIQKSVMVHPGGNTALSKVPQTNWDFLHQTIGFDFGLTAFYAVLHEIAYKVLAAFFGLKKDKPADVVKVSCPVIPVRKSETAPVLSEQKVAAAAKSLPRREKAENHAGTVEISRKNCESCTLAPA